MKKLILIIAIVFSGMLFVVSCQKENNPPEPGTNPQKRKVYNGDLTLPNIIELQQFYDSGYTVINGSVLLRNTIGLNDMKYFANVDTIKGHFDIDDNPDLTSFAGISFLKNIGGDFKINQNLSLENLNGLENLASIDGFFMISQNDKIFSLEGLNSLHTVKLDFLITGNESLTSLNGLNSFQFAERNIHIAMHPELNDIKSLSKLVSIRGKIEIYHNSKLTSLEGLNSLISLGQEFGWRSKIFNNSLLSDFCALTTLIQDGEHVAITFENNAYNPTIEDIENGNCSL